MTLCDYCGEPESRIPRHVCDIGDLHAAIIRLSSELKSSDEKIRESNNHARIMADAADANVRATASERLHHRHTLSVLARVLGESSSYLQTNTRHAAQMAINDGEVSGLVSAQAGSNARIETRP